MTITFENNNDVIVYTLKEIIDYARKNQYIFVVQSVWRIASVIGLTEGLVTDIDNLRMRSEVYQAPVIVRDAITIEEPNQLLKSIRDGLSTSIDLQEKLSSSKKTENIHPDRLIRIQNPLNENSDQEDLNEESE